MPPGDLAAAIGVTLLALAAHGNTLANGFAFDDQAIVVDNPLIRGLGAVPRLFTSGYWAGAFGSEVPFDLYRPAVLASFAVNYAVGGLAPLGYHLVNVLLHAAVALALLAVARQLGLGVGAAVTAAALFAVHPLATEAVAAVVGRADSLMALGLLAAWAAHLRGGSPGRASIPWTVASCAAFAVSLLAKEQAMVLPALLILSDLVAARGAAPPLPARAFLVRPWWRHGAHGLVLAGYLGLRILALRHPFALEQIPVVDNPLAALPWGARLPAALGVAARYLGLLVWPATLSADYSYAAIPLASSWHAPGALAGALAWGTLLVLAAGAGRRGHRPVALGLVLALLTFLPVSNLLVPIGTIMGERLFYVPAAGLCLALAAALSSALARVADAATRRRLVLGAAAGLGVAVLLLGARTVQRNRDWRGNDTLFASAVRAVPGSAKAWFIHGVLLAGGGHQGEAVAALGRAVEIRPDFSDAWLALGGTYEQHRQWRDAEAAYRRALTIREGALGPAHPGVAEALYYLAHLAFSEGELGDGPDAARRFAEAETLFRRALAIRERALGPAHPLVGQVVDGLGGLMATQRRDAEAETLFRRALAIREAALGPDHPDVALSLNNLALLDYYQGRDAEAEPLYRRSIAILERTLGPEHPSLAQRLDNYAALLRRTGRTLEAATMANRAQAIRSRAASSR